MFQKYTVSVLFFLYQWQSEHWPLLEARIRWQEDIDKPVAVQQKLNEFDLYLRLNWEFEGPLTWGL